MIAKFAFSSVLIYCLALLPTTAHSQTDVRWTNAGGGDWTDSVNWDGEAPIDGAFDVFVDLMASNPYTISNGSDTNIDSLTINSQQATVGVDADLTVSDQVLLQNGSLEFANDSIFNGSLNISNSGTAVFRDDSQFLGNIRVDGPDSVLTIAAGANRVVAGDGSVITLANGGQVVSEGSFRITEGTTVTGGGTINIENGIFSNSGGTIEVGSGQRLEVIDGTGVDNDLKFSSVGSIVIREGGELAVRQEDILITNFNGSSTLSTLFLDGGRMSSDERINIVGTSTSGNGTLEAPVLLLFSGTFSPGLEVGRIDIVGDVFAFDTFGVDSSGQDLEMELVFDINGTEQGTPEGHDFLFIDGSLGFSDGMNGDEGSFLRVNALEGLSLEELDGESLTIIELADSNEITGVFSNVDSGGSLTTEDGRFAFDVFYGEGSSFGANRVVLTNFSFVGVPEPSALMFMTFVAMATVTKRKKFAVNNQ